jgi:hypothetical protein
MQIEALEHIQLKIHLGVDPDFHAAKKGIRDFWFATSARSCES